MTKKDPINKLSIYLIKEEYFDHKKILKRFDTLKKETIKIDNREIGILYFGDSRLFEPAWVKKFFIGSFVNELNDSATDDFGNRKLKLFNASSKAVLLVDTAVDSNKNRIFAIPFGYGWTLLNHGVWEERFGLKVTLNTVDPNNLRRIDKKNMSLVPKDISEQLSREGVAADFGIDIEQDLIQSITGKTKEEEFGKTITGKDALSIAVNVDLSNINDFLKNCYQKYASDDYKKDFGWIDQIADIKDPKLVDSLNNRLIENINNKQLEKIWMAVPELVDWPDVAGFAYKNSEEENFKDDIYLSDFLDSLPEKKKDNLDLNIFKRKKVYCFSASNDEIKYQWSALNCLYCEINDENNKKTYLLSNGSWYEIEKGFVSQVDSDFQQLKKQVSSIQLPNYNHKNESDYNEKVAESDSEYCCMDGSKKVISHGGGYSKIEFCDLFSKNKKIVHIKRYGGSLVLSHLFLQGVVSGELFLSDVEFRKKLNDKLPDSHKISNPNIKPNSAEYEIIFGVISSSKKELELPFFSKVGLRNARRRLETYGYKVFLKKIETARNSKN